MSEIRKLTTDEKDIFLVRRTSEWIDKEKPCEFAFKVQCQNVDCRSVDDPRKIPANRGTDGGWYAKGSNHRVVNGAIMRDMGWLTKWAVKITDVMDFVDSNGECVISRDNNGIKTIEIYDDYRE